VFAAVIRGVTIFGEAKELQVKNRKSVSILVGLTALVGAVIGSGSVASADPGPGHVYTCSTINTVRETRPIAFKKIYTCSNGPMDTTSIQEMSTYTFRQTGWISGECAWKRYHYAGVRNMRTIWNYCLKH
jgi:hypothetical protein